MESPKVAQFFGPIVGNLWKSLKVGLGMVGLENGWQMVEKW